MVIEQSDMYAEIVHHIVCRNPSPWNRNRVILPNQSSRVQFFFDTRKVSFPLQNGNTTVHKVAENLDVRQKRGKHRVQLKDSEYTMTETSK